VLVKDLNDRQYDYWNETAPLYDLIYEGMEGDVEFYVNEARKANKVLEIGCGTGRITVPIAEHGVDITGIDTSDAMLHIIQKKIEEKGLREKIKLFKGDMRYFLLPDKFDLCIIPYRTMFVLITLEDQKRALLNIRRHLEPNGKIIFDVFLPDLKRILNYLPRWRLKTKKIVKPSGETLRVYVKSKYDAFDQIIDDHYIIKTLKGNIQTQKREYKLRFRYYFRFELRNLLENCGYQIVETYGDFTRSPLDENSENMVWIAQLSGHSRDNAL